jgi:hypothetical protein
MTKKNFVRGYFVFEDELKTDLITSADSRVINSGTITRVGDLITEVTQAGRTITINRDLDDVITGWEDTDYEWTITRDVEGNINEWEVIKK